MTKSLIKQLKDKGYLTIYKLNEKEVAATKYEKRYVRAKTDFDVFTLNKAENLNGLEIGKLYNLEELSC